MTTKAPRRQHSPEFKRKICREIRSGLIGRREAQRTYRLSDNLIHSWLAQSADDAITSPRVPSRRLAKSTPSAAYEDQIAVLERKVGQLTMALERRSRRERD